MHIAKTDVPRFLNEKRSRKESRRSARYWKLKSKETAKISIENEQFGKLSKIIELMAASSPKINPSKGKGIKQSFPETFSILDHPEQAIAAIQSLAYKMRAQRPGQVFLDLHAVRKYDLGANALLDVLVEEFSKQSSNSKRKINWRGTYPTDPAHKRFFQALGVIKRLKIEHEYPPQSISDKLVIFDARSKYYHKSTRAHETDKKSRETAKFANHINDCLQTVHRQMTEQARSSLCRYISEIIDNAEQHAGELQDWTIQGYLDPTVDTPLCEITIFNFGKSISETIHNLDTHSYTRSQIQQYVDMHQKGKIFRKGWRLEDLYSLMALQGNVSSKNKSEQDTRGNGTVDLINFFQRVYKECRADTTLIDHGARMAIVSGSTYMVFDGKYQMGKTENGNWVIAFNKDNDLESAPDGDYIRQLDGVSFPGTLISIKFPLSSRMSAAQDTETNRESEQS